MKSYAAVHFELVRVYGSASSRTCIGCGGTAKDWAYQHNGSPELHYEGLPYSEDLNCYQPMCRSCHRFLDNLHNPEYLEWLKTKGSAIARASLNSEKMKEVGRRLGEYTKNRRKTDPEFDRRVSEAGRRNIKAAIANPGPPEKVSADRAAAARVANAKKRACLDCGLTAHPAALGAHLKGSGHSGYRELAS